MKKMRVRTLNIEAGGGKTIAIINWEDARELGIHPPGRLILSKGSKKISVIVDVAEKFVREGEIAVYKEVQQLLRLKSGNNINVSPEKGLESKKYIKKKINGDELAEKDISTIVQDVIERNLSDIELASFVTALHIHGMTMEENFFMSKAMLSRSNSIRFPGTVVDKHSIGGVPGDKTTLLVVPIIAAAGLTIPKTSSRSITSAAGTADRMEVLAPVNLNINQIKKIVKKCRGCIAWGGAVDLAPADDLFIQIEHPLELDPLLLPSVMSKKKAVGSKYVVIDIPVGAGAKVATNEQAEKLASRFIELGGMLGMEVDCGITYASQPIGYSIGPGLEARDALETLMNRGDSEDLVDKATSIAGMLLKMVGKGGKETALAILKSGKAEKKMREIIKAQGGDPEIVPEDIKLSDHKFDVKAGQSGVVSGIANRGMVHMAWTAGAPKDKMAGITLSKKIGDYVEKGEILYTIYAEKRYKLREAVSMAKADSCYSIINRNRRKMLLQRIGSCLTGIEEISKKIMISPENR
jgi:AMP phosphorylase